jgi:hypothetical protein
MDKRAACLVGAVAGIATIGPALANAPPTERPDAHQVTSYADLLAPIPNAVELLKADDAQRSGWARVAQGYYGNPYYGYPPPPPATNYYSPYSNPYYYYHHHHHHHHHYHHHHHHHRD